ncbi:hypothetical protein Tco_1001153 [Tanacetum coccineum]
MSNTHQQSLADAGSETRPPMLEREDLRGDDLKHYEAEIEAMNLILISIPLDIYNSVDACTTAKAMWQRVERLMEATVQNKVDRETRFNNEFDQFVAKPGEALLQQFEKLVNASRAKKLEKSHDPLTLVPLPELQHLTMSHIPLQWLIMMMTIKEMLFNTILNILSPQQ